MAISERLKRFLDHPAGPKTIHFWAPAMKWGLVIAGLADINRPPEKISVSQTLGKLSLRFFVLLQVALTCTGLIWARYSTQIIPINYSLMTVNMFVAGTGLYQLNRVRLYR